MFNEQHIIHQQLLGAMPEMRRALGRHFKWFYHVTPLKNVESIRDTELRPGSDKAAPDLVKSVIGRDASKIICVNPLGADTVPPCVQGGPFACLAFRNEALPKRLSLDWSHDGGFGIAEVLRDADQSRDAAEIFVEAAKRWGSIVIYGSVASDHLVGYKKGCAPHDPGHWPALSTLSEGDMQTFG